MTQHPVLDLEWRLRVSDPLLDIYACLNFAIVPPSFGHEVRFSNIPDRGLFGTFDQSRAPFLSFISSSNNPECVSRV